MSVRDDAATTPTDLPRVRTWRRHFEWLSRSLTAERERWPLWTPVGVGVGAAAYFALPVEPPPWVAAAALGGAAALLAVGRRAPSVLVAAAAVAAVALGLGAAQLRAALVAAPTLGREIGPVTVSGRVVEVQPLPDGRRLLLDRLRVGGLASPPRRVRIRLAKTEPVLRPGDWVELRAGLVPPSAPAAPGAFDFQRHAYFQGIGAVGFAYGAARAIAPPAGEATDRWRWSLGLAALRQAIADRVRAVLAGAVGAIAVALTIGDQGAIPKDVLQAMRDSGLAHLLSISGLHIGLVAGILFFGLRSALALVPPLALARPIKKWAAAAALFGTFFYLLLSGAPVPTQRAFLMTGLVLVAVMLDRSAISMRLVAWAALVVLLLRPEALVGPSFQMSFAAVVALIAAYEATRAMRLARRAEAGAVRRVAQYVGDIAATSLIAAAATAPYVIFHFNRTADYGVAANMLAVPLTGFWIMPWAVVALLLMPFGLEAAALAPMGWGIEGVIAIARAVAAWPGAVQLVPAMPVAGLAFVTLGGLWLCLWQRPWRLLGLAGIVAGFATIALTRPPDVLVSEDGRLLAVGDPAGALLLSSRRVARFDAEIWLRQVGQAEPQTWPREGYGAGGRLACDSLGCIYRVDGHVVALARGPAALAEDCRIADIVVSTEPVRRACPSASLVIDRFDLWRDGGHALWIDTDGVRVRSVRQTRGARPWVIVPQPRGASDGVP